MLEDITQWLQQLLPFLDQAGDSISQAGHSAGAAINPALQKMTLPSMLALAGALGWASGFRLYAVVFLTGLMGKADWLALPSSMQLLEHPAILTASGFMLFMEFFADKIPMIDSMWDAANSFIRIPAGAALAGSVFGADSTTMVLAAAILGGTLAATAQAAKTTTRAAINTSPEPFSNVAMSLAEDGLMLGMLWLATSYPLIFAIVLLITVVCMVFITIILWRFLRGAIARIKSWLRARTTPVA